VRWGKNVIGEHMNGDSCERIVRLAEGHRTVVNAVHISLNSCRCDDNVVKENHLSAMGFNVHLDETFVRCASEAHGIESTRRRKWRAGRRRRRETSAKRKDGRRGVGASHGTSRNRTWTGYAIFHLNRNSYVE